MARKFSGAGKVLTIECCYLGSNVIRPSIRLTWKIKFSIIHLFVFSLRFMTTRIQF